MKAVSMSGSIRKDLGAKGAKELRNNGMVPCVIYGKNDPVHVAIDSRQFNQIVYTPNVYVINLDVEGTTYNVFLKDAQFHPVSDAILHADFFEPAEGQSFELKIPVTLKGTSPGVLNGGKLRTLFRKLRVRSTVDKFPDAIEVDISDLKIGMGVRVSEINLDGLEMLDSSNNYIVYVKTARGAVADDEEEAEAPAEAEAEAAE
jgi:large subunit ribosomal protein L25